MILGNGTKICVDGRVNFYGIVEEFSHDGLNIFSVVCIEGRGCVSWCWSLVVFSVFGKCVYESRMLLETWGRMFDLL